MRNSEKMLVNLANIFTQITVVSLKPGVFISLKQNIEKYLFPVPEKAKMEPVKSVEIWRTGRKF